MNEYLEEVIFEKVHQLNVLQRERMINIRRQDFDEKLCNELTVRINECKSDLLCAALIGLGYKYETIDGVGKYIKKQ